MTLVLYLPDGCDPHAKFVYASMLTSASRQLSATRSKTCTHLEEVAQAVQLDRNQRMAMSQHELMVESVRETQEREREELVKQHASGKETEAARSGGFHLISITWNAAMQSLLTDLFNQYQERPQMEDGTVGDWRPVDFKALQLVDASRAPTVIKYVQFAQDGMDLSGTLLKTAWASKPVADFFQEEEPRFLVMAYPVVTLAGKNIVRRVVVNWIPDACTPKVKMLYQMLFGSFKQNLRKLMTMDAQYNLPALTSVTTIGDLVAAVEADIADSLATL